MEDSWALKELAASIAAESEERRSEPSPKLTGYQGVLAQALDDALQIVGRNGRDVLYGVLEQRYGLRLIDLAEKPGIYMSAIRDILGSSGDVVERYLLRDVEERTGVKGHTLEDTVSKLKKKYGL